MTAVPSLPTTVSAGGKLTATNWNLMVNYLTFQRNPPRFKGSFTSPTAITAFSPILYPSTYDTASGYNAGTGQYTVQYAGTYRLSAQAKWGNVTPGLVGMIVVKNGTSVVASPVPPNAAYGGPSINTELVLAVSDVLSIQVGVGFTTDALTNGENNWCILTWTGS